MHRNAYICVRPKCAVAASIHRDLTNRRATLPPPPTNTRRMPINYYQRNPNRYYYPKTENGPGDSAEYCAPHLWSRPRAPKCYQLGIFLWNHCTTPYQTDFAIGDANFCQTIRYVPGSQLTPYHGEIIGFVLYFYFFAAVHFKILMIFTVISRYTIKFRIKAITVF